jgi:polar amino acid transport system substrate-binding protein
MRKLAPLFLFLVLAVAACGGDGGEEASPPPPPAGGATDTTAGHPMGEELPTKEPGVLIVGAEFPSPPFLIPPRENPTGFEVDIAEAIGERLGLEVRWLEIPWTSIFAPGPKRFDMNINETTITDERDRVIDFSDPYFEANQAVLAHTGTPAEDAMTLDALKELRLAAQAQTTGLDYIRNTIKPNVEPRVFPTTVAANQALLNEQIDAFIIDVPIAAGLVAESPDELVVTGQFVTNEEWGIVFEEGSELVEHVNGALAEIKDDGTLAQLQEKWLPGTDVPVIE